MGKMVKVCLDYIELDCEDVKKAFEEERVWLLGSYLEYDRDEDKLWLCELVCEPDCEDEDDPDCHICHNVTAAIEMCRGDNDEA